MSNRPKVFIASSREGLSEAKAINANLDHSTIPTLWPNGTFVLGSHSLESLTQKSSEVDFAVFVFTPDDIAEIRGKTEHIVRDNVLFELGLFIGALGKDRCFIVQPRGVDLHFPSDLLGITTADYAVDRGDGDLSSALNFACTKIEAEVNRLGPIRTSGAGATQKPTRAKLPNYQINPMDIRLLAVTASSQVSSPEGLTHWQISNEMTGTTANVINICALKLLRLGFIERTVREDRDGEPYYAISITDAGIDILLQNESELKDDVGISPISSKIRKRMPNFANMDDDIPF
ncbi:TIR domain-containing protein [Massilia sp. IC2-476]|uniref:TIR domain-containing protein n=1 Tax=Massilia sp. IC2-476 TaxID=2887199 RepID=UPI001D1005C4|nr:nucleotide-binding protein [Massilia sp. IC2-476]MCC2974700.1 nucleotide-binding protein [Massilia sp. IC2-476]